MHSVKFPGSYYSYPNCGTVIPEVLHLMGDEVITVIPTCGTVIPEVLHLMDDE